MSQAENIEDMLLVEYHGEDYLLSVRVYEDTHELALYLINEYTGEIIECTFSGISRNKGEVVLCNWGENKGVYTALVRSGIIYKKHKSEHTPYGTLIFCKITNKVHNYMEDYSIVE